MDEHCKFTLNDGSELHIFPDGENELDPCIYKDTEMYKNVTVIIGKCIKCGKQSIEWIRQEDTEEIDLTEEV